MESKHLSLKTIVRLNNNFSISNKKTKNFWYKKFENKCVFCNRDNSFKKRIYGNKPKTIEQRKEVFFLADCECYNEKKGE